MIYKTLHRKLKIEKHEPHYDLVSTLRVTTPLKGASPTSVQKRHHAAAPDEHKCSSSHWKLFTGLIGSNFSITVPFCDNQNTLSLVPSSVTVIVCVLVPDMYACQNDEIINALYCVVQ